MSMTITGVVTNGVVIPNTPLPEGAQVEIRVKTRLRDDTVQPIRPRGVPAAQVLGIAAGKGPPPDDETVKRWIAEHRLEKHG